MVLEEDTSDDAVAVELPPPPSINNSAMCVGGFEVPTTQCGADEEFMVFNVGRCQLFRRKALNLQGRSFFGAMPANH